MTSSRPFLDSPLEDSIPLIKPSRADRKHLPNLSELTSHLHFSPKDGRIWLDKRRMLLIDSHAVGTMRIELIESLGIEQARGLLTRMGYASGARDAQLARKIDTNNNRYINEFMIGPQLHAIEGVVLVETVKLDVNYEKGTYYGEFIWRDSAEGETHLNYYGLVSEPACWMQVGYACGFTSVFMGRPVLFREVQCCAMGHEVCRVVGKPLDQWQDVEDDLSFLQPQPFVNRKVMDMKPATPLSTPSAPQALDELSSNYDELVGVSARFSAACHMLNRVAPTNATVLFLGESGVGKEMFARTLHRISHRSDRPFIAVNCAAIPENLIEAELFGVEKGAYTGAVTSRAGRFELANGGTLFLDEVGTLSLSAQGKLLRALQEREIERVGSTETKKVNVRVIAATNINMKDEVKAGRFREDLYFRLNVFPIRIPPLRDRRDDVPLLMDIFFKRFTQQHGRPITGFTRRATESLLSYAWPGNIRELENVIERGVILAPDNGAIDICHLFTSGEQVTTSILRLAKDGSISRDEIATDDNFVPSDWQNHSAEKSSPIEALVKAAFASGESLDALREHIIDAAIDKANGNVSEAARLLNISRSRLDYRLRKRDEEN